MDAARCWLAAVDLWLVALGYLSKEEAINVIIELHAPTSSTQKLKLMGRGGQFTYIPTAPPALTQGYGLRHPCVRVGKVFGSFLDLRERSSLSKCPEAVIPPAGRVFYIRYVFPFCC